MFVKIDDEPRYLLPLQGPENARQDVCMNYLGQNEAELLPAERIR